MKKLILLEILFVVCLLCSDVSGGSDVDYWPSWRGSNNTGAAPKCNPPLSWSESKNIKWKVKLTGDESSSSPIIWKDKIFFQTAIKTDKEVKADPAPEKKENSGSHRSPPPTNIYKFDLVCLDRASGKLLWQKTTRQELPNQGHHDDHGFASFSPVTDGKLIWASFGSRGIHCYDLNGNKIWSKDLVVMTTRFGEGSSPALAGDAVIVVADHSGDSFIFAFEKKTGKLLWKKERDEKSSWSTPVVIDIKGKLQIVVSATNFTRSYDAKTGEVIWQCSGQTRNVVPTPVVGHGMVFCTSGFRGSALQAIKLGQTGDLTDTDAIVWQVKESTPYVPSPLLYNGKIYICSGNKAVISCYQAETGKANFVAKPLEEIKGIYASPVAAADKIYFVGRNGVSYVIKPSEKLEVLSINTLDDKFDSSPAIVDGEIYLKGKKNLYCIAESK